MKKTTFITIMSFFILNTLYSQVLWNENFDSYTIGSVNTNLNGQTPGKGGWYTSAQGHTSFNPTDFNISHENGRGNVLIIRSSLKKNHDPFFAVRRIWKDDIENIWDSRDTLNNILKYEYYIFIEKKSTSTTRTFEEVSIAKDNCIISSKKLNSFTNDITSLGITDKLNLPINTWTKVIVYLDYYTGNLYHEYPDKNYVIKSNSNIGVIETHALKSISFKLSGYDTSEENYQIKLDDFTISAINTLPKLNTIEYISEKFNVYPNPATNIVNITNSENLSVKQVEIYDTTGKLINTHNFNNEAEIQLNIETLTSGTYLLHLHTDEGTAVKKLIKK